VSRSNSEDENESERIARVLLERALGVSFVRVPTSSVRTPDYRSVDGPDRSVEVKRITVKEFNDLTAASRNAKSFDSSVLAGRWTVMLDRPTQSARLAPLPHFPDDDPSAAADYAAVGLRVVPKGEREVGWRAQHPGPKTETPRIKNLGSDLEPHLATLEAGGITITRGAHRRVSTNEETTALDLIAKRTGAAICMRRDLRPGESPGIDIRLTTRLVRTERADTMTGRIQLWLDSDESMNLRESLAYDAGSEHHAVLVFDPGTEPEHQAAVHQGPPFCPTEPLELGDKIDVLWFVLGPVACCFTAPDGWRSGPA
jgi:hypothetical protein